MGIIADVDNPIFTTFSMADNNPPPLEINSREWGSGDTLSI